MTLYYLMAAGGLLLLGLVAGMRPKKCRHEPEQEPAEKTAGDTAQSTQDDHDEGDHRIFEPHGGLDIVRHADERSAKTGHQGTQTKA